MNFINKKTLIMGILNVTPDSFSDGGLFNNVDTATKHAESMIKDGANIIDVGGESTRPGAQPVSIEEEISRVVPVITAIRKQFNDKFLISIDTNKSQVAQAALDVGADIINSLGGFMFDKELISVAKKHKCPVVIYHIKGEPRTMQQGEIIYKDVINDITEFFNKQINLGLQNGLKKEQFILDPGIGFGKTVEQNIEVIKRLSEFKKLSLPILVGVSRKSHLGIILKEALKLGEIPSLKERIEAALAETAIAVLNGANIIRTHDVLTTKKFLAVIDMLI